MFLDLAPFGRYSALYHKYKIYKLLNFLHYFLLDKTNKLFYQSKILKQPSIYILRKINCYLLHFIVCNYRKYNYSFKKHISRKIYAQNFMLVLFFVENLHFIMWFTVLLLTKKYWWQKYTKTATIYVFGKHWIFHNFTNGKKRSHMYFYYNNISKR